MALISAAGCVLSLGAARAADTPATAPAAAPVSVTDSAKAAPAKDLNQYAPGILDERLRLPSRNVDVPVGQPTPSQPSMSRKDFLRLMDRQEEKRNWMFVEPGTLSKERELREEPDFLKSRWDVKEEGRRKSWYEYDSPSTQPQPRSVSSGAGVDKQDRIAAEEELRRQVQRDRDRSESGRSGRSISSGMDMSKGRESGSSASAHQSGDLTLKDLFSGNGSDPKASSTGGSAAWDLFPSSDVGSRDRELQQSQTRRQEFRDFLNASRVAKPVADPVTAPNAGALSSFGGFDTRPVNNSSDFFNTSRTTPGGQDFNSGRSQPSSSFQDTSRGSSFGSAFQQQQPVYRPSSEPREYITPQMMNSPKRRF